MEAEAQERLNRFLSDQGFAMTALRSSLRGHRPRTQDEFIAYVEAMYGLNLATNHVCPEHTPPGEIWWKFFNLELGNSLVAGSRGSGKTNGLALLEHLWMDFDADTILHAGAIESQSEKGYGYFEAFCKLPHFRDLVAGDVMRSKTKFHNGAEVTIVPATPAQLNGPHTRVLLCDETELWKRASLKEAVSIPMRRNGRPPLTIHTSSRKYAHGPFEGMIKDHQAKGLNFVRWCVFEIVEQCQPERHKNGAGCRGNPEKGLAPCRLMEDCLFKEIGKDGVEKYVDGPGRATLSNGHMNIDDVIVARGQMGADDNTWNSQWMTRRASTEGLIYPQFDADKHVIPMGEYEWNTAKPVYEGGDFGFTNPAAFVFGQLYDEETLIIFAEMYSSGFTNEEWAEKHKELPWWPNLASPCHFDPSRPEAIATFRDAGLPADPADNDLEGGYARVRYLLKPAGHPRPFLFFTENCVQAIDQMQTLHVKQPTTEVDPKEAQQTSEDHATDAVRYLSVGLFGRGLVT